MPKDEEGKTKAGFLPAIKYGAGERANLYLGALLVIFFQLTVITLIINEMAFGEFKIVPPKKFSVILPRTISAVLGHIKVEPDIRAGLSYMKYCLNHPEKFLTA